MLNIKQSYSSASLDSIFSKSDTTSTSTTPVDYAQPHPLSHKKVCELLNRLTAKCVVLMVGLPASGKSTICRQFASYLNAKKLKAEVYNAGNIRRLMQKENSDAEFFNPENRVALEQREQYATIALDNMLDDLRGNKINVGFLDATNTTRARRSRMLARIHGLGIPMDSIVILNVSCTDQALFAYNIQGKATNLDYCRRDVKELIADFTQRSNHYFKVYEPISAEEIAEHDVKYLSIENGKVGSVVRSSHESDIAVPIEDFVVNYYLLHGMEYEADVKNYYGN